jgi:hypothetical protein
LNVDPRCIPEPLFEEVKAKIKAEKEEDMDTFIKKHEPKK